MEDLSLHILDIAENSIHAGADKIEIRIRSSEAEDKFFIMITDNGTGMDEKTLRQVKDPFFTTKTVMDRKKTFGLGIPLLSQTAEECGGALHIDSKAGHGTVITAEFQRSHIDIKPLGNLGATIMALVGGHPAVDVRLIWETDSHFYSMDTAEIKKELDGAPINLPQVLKWIKDDVNEATGGV